MNGTEKDGLTMRYAFKFLRGILQWGNFAHSLLFVENGSNTIGLSLMMISEAYQGRIQNANSYSSTEDESKSFVILKRTCLIKQKNAFVVSCVESINLLQFKMASLYSSAPI